jgi:hypothetical protein
MSIERLVNLAKKTGDTLIIHDPREGRDMVIMDIDRYESFVLRECLEDEYDECRDVDGDSDINFDTESPWHRTSDLLTDRIRSGGDLYDFEDHMYEMAEPAIPMVDYSSMSGDGDIDDAHRYDGDERTGQSLDIAYDNIVVNEVIGEPIEYSKKSIPEIGAGDISWQDEETLDGSDDPVFYEEPV